MEQGLYIKLYITVSTEKEMDIEELIEEFEQNCDYNIIGTDNIKVKDMQYLETTITD